MRRIFVFLMIMRFCVLFLKMFMGDGRVESSGGKYRKSCMKYVQTIRNEEHLLFIHNLLSEGGYYSTEKSN